MIDEQSNGCTAESNVGSCRFSGGGGNSSLVDFLEGC